MFALLYKAPLRKALAIFASLLVGSVVITCLIQGRDVPPEIATLLQWFGGITLAAYYTSSSYEAVRKCDK